MQSLPLSTEGLLPLAGLGVLVTRPAHQSAALCRLLEEWGAIPFSFPVIEIVEPEDTAALCAALAHPEIFDLAIFMSPNAVTHTFAWIKRCGGWANPEGHPTGWIVAAVGQGTARELAHFGWTVDIVPVDRFDSEALLEDSRLAKMEGQRVILFRGVGGRETLAQELTRRGAIVTPAEVYRRLKASVDPTELVRRIADNTLHAAVVTSSEGLSNLYDLLGLEGRDWLQQARLVVFSFRTARLARALGLKGSICVVRQATDAAVREALFRPDSCQQPPATLGF